jgi:hypothetical protein
MLRCWSIQWIQCSTYFWVQKMPKTMSRNKNISWMIFYRFVAMTSASIIVFKSRKADICVVPDYLACWNFLVEFKKQLFHLPSLYIIDIVYSASLRFSMHQCLMEHPWCRNGLLVATEHMPKESTGHIPVLPKPKKFIVYKLSRSFEFCSFCFTNRNHSWLKKWEDTSWLCY